MAIVVPVGTPRRVRNPIPAKYVEALTKEKRYLINITDPEHLEREPEQRRQARPERGPLARATTQHHAIGLALVADFPKDAGHFARHAQHHRAHKILAARRYAAAKKSTGANGIASNMQVHQAAMWLIFGSLAGLIVIGYVFRRGPVS